LSNFQPSLSSQEQLFSTFTSRFGTRIAIAIVEIYGWKYRRILSKAQRWKSNTHPNPLSEE
jgi:hypothetical protein